MGFSQPEQKIKECKPLTTINVREDEEEFWVKDNYSKHFIDFLSN